MPEISARLATLASALVPNGFSIRGGFHPTDEDGIGAKTLLMIGNVGPAMWRAFETYAYDPETANPLDDWTKRTLEPIAHSVGARAVYPSDGPPYHPFQRWAMRCEPVAPSPLGLLIHPEYGLWHAYRAAFLFDESLPVQDRGEGDNPCESCETKPCLSTCPVGALDEATGYDVPACTAHVRSADGGSCRARGCLARHACPVGKAYAYDDAQSAFHIAAFERARD